MSKYIFLESHGWAIVARGNFQTAWWIIFRIYRILKLQNLLKNLTSIASTTTESKVYLWWWPIEHKFSDFPWLAEDLLAFGVVLTFLVGLTKGQGLDNSFQFMGCVPGRYVQALLLTTKTCPRLSNVHSCSSNHPWNSSIQTQIWLRPLSFFISGIASSSLIVASGNYNF